MPQKGLIYSQLNYIWLPQLYAYTTSNFPLKINVFLGNFPFRMEIKGWIFLLMIQIVPEGQFSGV